MLCFIANQSYLSRKLGRHLYIVCVCVTHGGVCDWQKRLTTTQVASKKSVRGTRRSAKQSTNKYFSSCILDKDSLEMTLMLSIAAQKAHSKNNLRTGFCGVCKLHLCCLAPQKSSAKIKSSYRYRPQSTFSFFPPLLVHMISWKRKQKHSYR